MGAKTFKIGLSNADKQNMAQSVFERLVAMCFDEYDATKTYNKGDFVVYENPTNTFKLYKSNSDSVTGTWNSAKWDLATFQDLVEDIEDAVSFVNDKANVDGNYPTMTVGAADNLTPYDEDSGVDQEQPFLLQGTGCGNGETQVDTGKLALMKNKQGNSKTINNQTNINYATGEGLTTNGTKTVSNRVITATSVNGLTRLGLANTSGKVVQGHKYLFLLDVKVANTDASIATMNAYFDVAGALGVTGRVDFQNNVWTKLYIIKDFTGASQNNPTFIFYKDLAYTDASYSMSVRQMEVIDLTQMFGSNDNIPAHLLAHPEDFFRYYQGSLAYNEGTLVNANGRYLKTIGRNQWDEDAKLGYYINSNTGEENAAEGFFCSKNFIRVVPNETYYLRKGTSDTHRIFFYDKDKNYIGNTPAASLSAQDFVVPANCCYIKFWSEGATYNHDITISIYYEGESGYDQYYPYEVLTNNDTGTETLRSAGSVADSKAPDGTITRKVGVYTISSNTTVNANGDIFYIEISDMKSVDGTTNRQDGLKSSKFIISSAYQIDPNYMDDLSILRSGSYIYIRDTSCADASAFLTKYTGVDIYYELDEPTEEQGTTFSENVVIDDFGSMDFAGSNNVPQGASIFYAVDYKAFVDSLYNTLDGDATDIVKESELDSKLATLGYVKLTSVSGYDATKTQVLKNVEGTLTWVTEE